MFDIRKMRGESETPDEKHITVYIGESQTFKTTLCLKNLATTLYSAFSEKSDAYSIIVMDVDRFRSTRTIFNHGDEDHPRILRAMKVFPAGCLEDISLLLCSLMAQPVPPSQIFIDDLERFMMADTLNANPGTPGSDPVGYLPKLLLQLNEFARNTMCDDSRKKILITLGHSKADMPTLDNNNTMMPLKALSQECHQILHVFRSTPPENMVALSPECIELAATQIHFDRVFGKVTETDTPDTDVRLLNEYFLQAYVEEQKAREQK